MFIWLLRIILRLNFARSLKEPIILFHNNSTVTLLYSPVTKILNENCLLFY